MGILQKMTTNILKPQIMKTNYRNKQRGYLYIDAILAMFILTVAVVTITEVFIASTKLSVTASRYTTATNIAQQQVELLKRWTAAEWSDPDLPNSIPWQDDPNKLTVNKTTFVVQTIIAHPNDVDPSLLQVTVIVSWNEVSCTHSVQLTTYFSKV